MLLQILFDLPQGHTAILLPNLLHMLHRFNRASLILAQPQSPAHVPPDHIAVDRRFSSLVLAVRVERLAQHAGVEESV
jgi:hypothetical protein